MVLFVPPSPGHQNNTVSYSSDSGSQCHLGGRKTQVINGVNYTLRVVHALTKLLSTFTIITFYITYDPMKTVVSSMNIVSSG